jgi:hypothetical protein
MLDCICLSSISSFEFCLRRKEHAEPLQEEESYLQEDLISHTIGILTKGLSGLASLSLSINISTCDAVSESLLKQLMTCP